MLSILTRLSYDAAFFCFHSPESTLHPEEAAGSVVLFVWLWFHGFQLHLLAVDLTLDTSVLQALQLVNATVKAQNNTRPQYRPPTVYTGTPGYSVSHCTYFMNLVINIFDITFLLDVS